MMRNEMNTIQDDFMKHIKYDELVVKEAHDLLSKAGWTIKVLQKVKQSEEQSNISDRFYYDTILEAINILSDR